MRWRSLGPGAGRAGGDGGRPLQCPAGHAKYAPSRARWPGRATGRNGPRPGFLVHIPASPGIACFTSVPRRALSAWRGRSRSRKSESIPRGARAVLWASAVAPVAEARAWVGIGTRAVPGARWRSLGRARAGGPRRWADGWRLRGALRYALLGPGGLLAGSLVAPLGLGLTLRWPLTARGVLTACAPRGTDSVGASLTSAR